MGLIVNLLQSFVYYVLNFHAQTLSLPDRKFIGNYDLPGNSYSLSILFSF